MSYYDDSSLFVAPNGYKTSVLFAQKPMDANGQLAFTRSNSTATRVASNGLIEKVRTNLVLHSEAFDNAYWTKTNTTITANATTAPDGSLTADKLVETAALGDHAVARVGGMSAAGVYALSVFAKAGERTRIAIGNSSAAHYAIFDLSLGTVVQASQGTVTNGTISSIDANGFYRVSCTITVASAASVVFNLVSTGTTISYTGDGTSGLFIWGAQLETGDIATDYIPTTTAAVSVGPVANVPRLDYTGSTCGKLLLEPQRTNLATNSEIWNGTGWIAESASVTANAVISPSGYQDADTLNGTGSFSRLRQSGFALADNTNYTVSSFLRAGTAYSVRLTFVGKDGVDTGYRFNLQDGTAQSGAKIEDYGNGWYRCSFTANSGSGATTTSVRFASNDAGTTGGWTTGLTIHAWGAQLEAGGYATSYIPTLGAAVTRGADAASKTGISALIGQTEGTVFIEFNINADASRTLFSVDDGSTSNYIAATLLATSQVRVQIREAGAATNIITSSALSLGRHKIAVAYKSGDYALYIDGVQASVSTSTAYPVGTLNQFVLNSASYGSLGDGYNQALLFKTRLTNAQLAELTTI